MAKYLFILNPAAGRGAAGRSLEMLKALLDATEMRYQIRSTAGPGDATELARGTDAEVVVVVGGDGTTNEVANGIVGTEKTLGILPAGCGNDLIKSLGVPKDFRKAFEIIRTGKRKIIDTGTVACSDTDLTSQARGSYPERVFVNGVGIGLDAAVAERTIHLPKLSGTLLYLVALLQAVWRFKRPLMKIQRDSGISESKRFLVAIGNGRCAGGGFYLTPDALVDDGLLDICIVDDMPLYNIFPLIPKVMMAKHHHVKGITLATAKHILVSTDRPIFVHADGEIVGRNVSQVQIAIRPKSLNVIVGEREESGGSRNN